MGDSVTRFATPETIMPTNRDDNTPFTIDGETIAHIHHDAGRVPYLLITDEHGNTWRIYGYAQVALCEGGGGEWLPNDANMRKVIYAWQKRREIVRQAREELQKT